MPAQATHINVLGDNEKDLPLIRDLIARFDTGSPKPLLDQATASPPAATAPAIDEPLLVRVFNLKHVDPKTVINAITTAFGDPTTRVAAGNGNGIVVRAKEKAMAAIEQLLQTLDEAPDRSQEMRTIIFPLKHAKAAELAPVLQRAVPGLRECIPWTSANSLLVTGTAKAIETARTLVAELDAPSSARLLPPPTNEPITKLFPLAFARPNPALLDALRAAAGDDSSVVPVPDIRSIIVTAKPNNMAAVESILSQIDKQTEPAEAPAVGLRIRFLWLVSGLPDDKSSPPPADLLPLVEDLQRIGVTGLRLATQNVVEATPGGRFVVKASPLLVNRVDLELEGRFLNETATQPCIELEARAIEYAPYLEPERNGFKVFEKRELCTLETTVVTPMGKAIIAGVTAIDRMTGVFVVQVLPQ
ncbi:MAG: secretin N-terminal domain-containing protein [Phycisphaerae bacterium]